MKVLCIGDSNTFGYDPRSFLGERYPEGVRWTDRLENAAAVNWGINGITIPGDCSVYVDLIRRKDPDLVTVMLGTNDILQNKTALETAHNMESFLDAISAAGKKILLIAPPLLQHGEFVQTEDVIEGSRELGKLYRGVAARKGCLFADAGEWGVELSFDGVHFTEKGHDAFAKNLDKVLEGLQ